MNATREISFHVLQFVVERARNGDVSTALDLGFSLDEIRSMEQLTMKDLSYLSQLSNHFLRVEVDASMYRAMLERVREESRCEEIQDALLFAGAPRSLMNRLYGWTTGQYATRRKVLGLNSVGGRPREPDEETASRVWGEWLKNSDLEVGERCLATAQASGVSVTAVWNLVQEWVEEGLVEGCME